MTMKSQNINSIVKGTFETIVQETARQRNIHNKYPYSLRKLLRNYPVRACRIKYPVFNPNQLQDLTRGEDIFEIINISNNNVPYFIWRDKKLIRFVNTIKC